MIASSLTNSFEETPTKTASPESVRPATETQTEQVKPTTKNPLWFPSQCLIILAVNNILNIILVTIYKYFTNLPIETSTFMEFVGAANGICVIQGIVIWGCINMQRRKGFVVARIGAILAAFPFTSPLLILGIPFGIWVLILIARPTVRESFQS